MGTDTMPAGREMDALIAERIFGWKKHKWEKLPGTVKTDYCPLCKTTKASSFTPTPFENYCLPGTIPYYSTDISAAWQVVEKFDNACMLNNVHGIWECYLPDAPRGEADTAPLAICRAALKAIETA